MTATTGHSSNARSARPASYPVLPNSPRYCTTTSPRSAQQKTGDCSSASAAAATYPALTITRTWARARAEALTAQQAASPLAARPYDLRHAAVSTWLNAGVPATQVAEWAGRSVEVLPTIYAKCIDGDTRDTKPRAKPPPPTRSTQGPFPPRHGCPPSPSLSV